MTYYVYAIGPKDNGPIKIGFTNNLEARLKTIQTSFPEKVCVHHYIEFDNEKDMRKTEKQLHATLRHLCEHGEWFNLTPEQATLELNFATIVSEN